MRETEEAEGAGRVSDKPWKRAQRRIAELLGGQRVPVSGRGRGDVADIACDRLAVEVKSRKTLPAWLEDALRQAEACAKGGQLPVVVLHEGGSRYADALVVTRLSSFVQSLTECSEDDENVRREGEGVVVNGTMRRY